MSHQITSTDGLVLVKKPAWHGLGTVVEHAPTPAEALQIAGLDWNVEQWPLTALQNDVSIDAATHVANIRADTRSLLGVVGVGYAPVQNAELAAFCAALGEARGEGEGGVRVESAGSIRGGKRVWFLVRGESIWVNPKDEVKPYLLVANGHDGSLSVTFQPTTIRVVCRNTLHASLAEGERQGTLVRYRHEGRIADKLSEAKRALGLLQNASDRFARQARVLDARSMGRDELQRFWMKVYTASIDEIPQNPTSTAETRRVEQCKRVLGQWATSFDQELQAMRTSATAWTALNAVTNWLDHHRVVRGASESARADRRVDSNWWGPSAEAKAKALSLALTR